eukprot:9485090-Pyramimonas_sp.AAC.3
MAAAAPARGTIASRPQAATRASPCRTFAGTGPSSCGRGARRCHAGRWGSRTKAAPYQGSRRCPRSPAAFATRASSGCRLGGDNDTGSHRLG